MSDPRNRLEPWHFALPADLRRLAAPRVHALLDGRAGKPLAPASTVSV
ncbi:hypothetical protein R8Z50_18025 [Longispora sp. K20-0274]